MTISKAEAVSALMDIQQVQRKTAVTVGHELASPHLIVWGAVWTLGFIAGGMLPPQQWGFAWLPLITLGATASFSLGLRTGVQRPGTRSKAAVWRTLLITIVMTAILLFVGAVVGPLSPRSYTVLPALVLGSTYTIIGLTTLPRLAWIGITIVGSSMAGFWLAGPALPFWVAGTGGGGLVLGGLWLRRV